MTSKPKPFPSLLFYLGFGNKPSAVAFETSHNFVVVAGMDALPAVGR